jgi:hypothetical protein
MLEEGNSSGRIKANDTTMDSGCENKIPNGVNYSITGKPRLLRLVSELFFIFFKDLFPFELFPILLSFLRVEGKDEKPR